jgi:hypothetical protein
MLTKVRGEFHHFPLGLLCALSLCLAVGVLMATPAQAAGRDARSAARLASQTARAARPTPPARSSCA